MELTPEHIKAYVKTLKNICPCIEEEAINFMSKRVSVSYLNSKTLYLKAGQLQKTLGFTFQGLLRAFYINDKGEEITIAFIKENDYATDYGSFLKQEPSKYFIETIEPTVLINVSFEAIQECYSKFKNCEKYGRLIAEHHLINRQSRIDSFVFKNAEQRYIDFTKYHKDILNRVSLTHLSTYLGIKRQTLTRIRKKILQNSL